MKSLTILLAALTLAACGRGDGDQKAAAPEGPDPTIAIASEPGAPGLDRSQQGKPAPDSAFNDPSGEETTLADFAGRPVLLNLWASWCVPCVKELPTLDAVANAGGETGLQVLALSQDSAPHASVVAFLAKHKIATLEPYQDPAMRMSGALGAQILPTSILFDADGREVWRFVGDLDWTSPQAAKLLAEARVPATG